MEIELSEHYLKKFKTEVAVQSEHDRLIEQLNEYYMTTQKDVVIFPASPLGNTEDFIQIQHSFELYREGIDMHHCVGSYARYLRDGREFMYKVLTPERGTLHLKRQENGVDIKQFALACNKQPSPESFFKVRLWLEDTKYVWMGKNNEVQ